MNVINRALGMTNMPTNCRMKGMHDSSSNNNKDNMGNALESKIDMKA